MGAQWSARGTPPCPCLATGLFVCLKGQDILLYLPARLNFFITLIADVTRPTANCPEGQIVNANRDGNTTAVVIWNSPSCSDNSQMNVLLECTNQPGTEFSLGNTTVKCNCTDVAGNMDQCSFDIFVKDVTRPTANCPNEQIVNATLETDTKAFVTWSPATCSDNSQNVQLSCTHQPEAQFGLGKTKVQCICTDISGNTDRCSFKVVVKGS
ncbi:Hyalin [Holothuria leucospilota]|uniref:Hyalin n=1 Tax=Holothuria leucospilota TaxID=206669 RepID=A0A9Q1C1J7_HOLLE|nr:Hyalin [Holothuria leucospilota]